MNDEQPAFEIYEDEDGGEEELHPPGVESSSPGRLVLAEIRPPPRASLVNGCDSALKHEMLPLPYQALDQESGRAFRSLQDQSEDSKENVAPRSAAAAQKINSPLPCKMASPGSRRVLANGSSSPTPTASSPLIPIRIRI